MFESTPAAHARQVFHVSELVRDVKTLLERSFPLVWVQGEISNLARPSSGHWYFSLKDEAGQVRCAMFRTRNMHLDFAPQNGMQVVIRARVSLYEQRGEFQLIAEHMEEAGDGALQRAFELLKQRLSAEGLFDAERKKPLPGFPRRIGVITSPSGAAIRDILSVHQRRFPGIPVLLYPVPVQGQGAGEKIARAIQQASQRKDCDVLILARGGGSLEDLWSFNEEVVARAVAACQIPLVCGVGHEIDFTIADFVADRRAPTPSAAAELVTPNRDDFLQAVAVAENRLLRQVNTSLARKKETLRWLEKRIQHPSRRLQNLAQRLDDQEQRLNHARRVHFRHLHSRLAQLEARLGRHTPLHTLRELTSRQATLKQRLLAAQVRVVESRHYSLITLTRALDAVSPLATLNRGYAIVCRTDGSVVRAAREVEVGDRVEARLGKGKLLCTVEEKKRS